MTRPKTVSWTETRAKRPPIEATIARHRIRFDAEARAYRLREIGEERGVTPHE